MDKNKIRQLADYAVRECCDNSDNCYWTVSYDELYYHFGAEVSDTNENGRLLEEELRQREEINELIMTEDCTILIKAIGSVNNSIFFERGPLSISIFLFVNLIFCTSYEIEIRPLETPYYREIGIAVKDKGRLTPAAQKFTEYLKFRETPVNNSL